MSTSDIALLSIMVRRKKQEIYSRIAVTRATLLYKRAVRANINRTGHSFIGSKTGKGTCFWQHTSEITAVAVTTIIFTDGRPPPGDSWICDKCLRK